MLNKKQRKCLELMAIGKLSQREIASQIDIAEETISRWKKDDEFMDELDRLTKTSIRSLAPKAVKTQTKLLDAKSEMVRYLVSKDILDRAGYKSEDIINLKGNVPIIINDNIGKGC